jgi:hypothetical protein
MTKYHQNYLEDSEKKFYFAKFSLFNQNNLKKRFFINYDCEKYFELYHCKINISNASRYSIFMH